MVPQEATFSAKLETLLKSHYGEGRVEVLNAGVVGYNSKQVLEHFTQFEEILDFKVEGGGWRPPEKSRPSKK